MVTWNLQAARTTYTRPQLFLADALFETQVVAKSPAMPRMFVEYSLNDFLRREGGHMPRTRKSSCQYDAYFAGCAFTLSVVLVTFMLIAHGVHF